MDSHLERINDEDPRNDWARFYTFQGLVIADTIGSKGLDVINGWYVIGLKPLADLDEHEPFALVCADDKPIFRIRTFESFAAARRFMSSLVLRGVNVKMRVLKADRFNIGKGIF